MPELPEVEALAAFLRDHAVGCAVARIDVVSVQVLKTYDPPVDALAGLVVQDVQRRGKFLDLDIGGLHLVTHLSRAGWLQWRDTLPAAPPRPGRGPLALRVHLDAGDRLAGAPLPGLDLTEAGTQKRLAVYVVTDPAQVPGIAALGPDPLDPAFDRDAFAALLAASGQQVKGVLRDQRTIAGIGNAYSDEILHAARLSPFRAAKALTEAEVDRLWTAMQDILGEAVRRSVGEGTGTLKAEKRAGMRVHGRTGEACPVCGDVIREVSFADRSLQYCARCQTDGKPLADRRMSRLLR